MSDDPYEGQEWLDYADHVRKTLIPMIRESPVTMSLMTGSDFDPKVAMETGYMILMDKPIITVVTPGVKVPRKLAMVSDEIVEADLDKPEEAAKQINEAMLRIRKKFSIK
jgi:nucleoside 2-deoxyribosyltransferase